MKNNKDFKIMIEAAHDNIDKKINEEHKISIRDRENKIEEIYTELICRLPTYLSGLVRELDDEMCHLERLRGEIMFEEGFRCGAKFMKEVCE